ncbi:MAG: ParB/RepB/Spo0J family partition protein, partial [Acidimicrobiales bacterium]
MARRSGLGKGLGALIPTALTTADGASVLMDLPLGNIEPNPHQPRSNFDEEALASLTASVRELGVLQPVLVRPVGGDRYQLIAGERRWRAARRAGLSTIPAISREITETASVEQALVENLHRQDLNPLEEAAAYQQLIEDFGLTHDELSKRVGRSRVAITNTLRLFQLPPSVQKMVAERTLTAGHARAILGTLDRSFQESLARRAVAEQLSVRAVEAAVRARQPTMAPSESAEPSPPTVGTTKLRAPGLLELEELLATHLDTRVAVTLGSGRGRVTIDFAT